MGRTSRWSWTGSLLGALAGIGIGFGAHTIERALDAGTDPGTVRPGLAEIVVLAIVLCAAVGALDGVLLARLGDGPAGRGVRTGAVLAVGVLAGATVGSAVGILVGLSYPPTVAFAMVEAGLPGAVAGGLLTLFGVLAVAAGRAAAGRGRRRT